jgi:glycosyltransferase involved in cell wall biosynthesis
MALERGGRPPRTALVHDWLTGMRGGEAVLEAIASLFPQAPIFTLLHVAGSVSPALELHPIHASFLQRVPGVARHYRRLLPLFPAAVEDFDLGGFDLVISSSHCAAKGVIPPPGSYHLCYCHTPMRYAWDQEHAYFPRRRGLRARLRGLALTALRAWDVAASARVDRFLANSRFVAERIRRFYGREARVLPPPVDADFFSPAATEGESAGTEGGPYVLAVAALARYKRLDLAIEACRRLGLELRVVGTGPEWSTLKRLAGSGVRFLGRVDRERLRSLYRGALCLVQPGIEDFGIAPVEALACGTPVVALGRGGVLDVVEDGVHGVLYQEQESASAVAEAIDSRRRIRFNPLDLRRRAEAFSIMRFNERLKSILAEIPLPAERGR